MALGAHSSLLLAQPLAPVSTALVVASTPWSGPLSTSMSGSSLATTFPQPSSLASPTSASLVNPWPTSLAATSTTTSTTTLSSSTPLSAAPGLARPSTMMAALLHRVSNTSPATLLPSRMLTGLSTPSRSISRVALPRPSATSSVATPDRPTATTSRFEALCLQHGSLDFAFPSSHTSSMQDMSHPRSLPSFKHQQWRLFLFRHFHLRFFVIVYPSFHFMFYFFSDDEDGFYDFWHQGNRGFGNALRLWFSSFNDVNTFAQGYK